jgi:4-hydroxybenzoate polyprenyltransferase
MIFHSAQLFGSKTSRMARPQNVLYPGFLAALTAYVQTHSFAKAIVCYLAVLLLYALAAGYNNLSDKETDRLNKRTDNPMVSEQFNKYELRGFFAFNLLGLLVLQLFLHQPATIILCALYCLLSIAYSNRRVNIKSRGYFATLLLCLCYGVLPLLIGYHQHPGGDNVLLLCILQLLLIFPVLLAKDYKDEAGDKKTGKNTPLLISGPRSIKRLSIFISIATAAVYVSLSASYYPVSRAFIAMGYILLVAQLHMAGGKVSREVRLLLTAAMLLISLSAMD